MTNREEAREFRMEANRKKKVKLLPLLRIGISVALILFLVYTIDLPALQTRLAQVNPLYLGLALIVALLDRVLMAWKWNLLLVVKRIALPWLKAVGLYWIASFLGLFLPATVGGDALRVFALAKNGYPTDDAISSILVERLLGFGALFAFALAGLVASFVLLGHSYVSNIDMLFWLFVGLLFLLGAGLYFSFREHTLRRLASGVVQLAERIKAGGLVRKLGQVYQSYCSYRAYPWTLGLFFGLSLLENLLPLLWTYLLALAFGLRIDLIYFFVLIPVVLVLVRLPISLDGIGLHEGAFVFFLSQVGVAPADAFLLGLASHILGVISLMPGGILYAIGGLSVERMDSHPAVVIENPVAAEKSW